MALTIADSPARSNDMPAGVTVQPRWFTFDDLDAVPQYWFSGNPVLTHMDNAFSILIPPGEKFFVGSVQAYADELPYEEARGTAACLQRAGGAALGRPRRGQHQLRQVGRRHRARAALRRRGVPQAQPSPAPHWQLGITAFSEHLTATSADLLFVRAGLRGVARPADAGVLALARCRGARAQGRGFRPVPPPRRRVPAASRLGDRGAGLPGGSLHQDHQPHAA